ncbi:MAG: hypothetical protein R3E26_10220 [Nitrosomonas sp.]
MKLQKHQQKHIEEASTKTYRSLAIKWHEPGCLLNRPGFTGDSIS